MFNLKHILAFLLCSTLAIPSGYAQAMKASSHRFIHPPFTLGLTRGIDYLDVSRTGYASKLKGIATTGMLIRIPIITQFKVETGLKYSHILQANAANSQNVSNTLPAPSTTISVPITIQYYLNPGNRIQSYIGIGTMLSMSNVKSPALLGKEIAPSTTGNEFISLMFTQGIIFEINTKINISEEIHILNTDGKKTMGFNVGVGFKMP
jgi:outer membrane protein W